MPGWNVLYRHWPEPGLSLCRLSGWKVLDWDWPEPCLSVSILSGWIIFDRNRDADERDVHSMRAWHVFWGCGSIHEQHLPVVPGGQVLHGVWPVPTRAVLCVRGRRVFNRFGMDRWQLFCMSCWNILDRGQPYEQQPVPPVLCRDVCCEREEHVAMYTLPGWDVLYRDWPEPGVGLRNMSSRKVFDRDWNEHIFRLWRVSGRDLFHWDWLKLELCLWDMPGWHVFDWHRGCPSTGMHSMHPRKICYWDRPDYIRNVPELLDRHVFHEFGRASSGQL